MQDRTSPPTLGQSAKTFQVAGQKRSRIHQCDGPLYSHRGCGKLGTNASRSHGQRQNIECNFYCIFPTERVVKYACLSSIPVTITVQAEIVDGTCLLYNHPSTAPSHYWTTRRPVKTHSGRSPTKRYFCCPVPVVQTFRRT
jgi:hypothetical protein